MKKLLLIICMVLFTVGTAFAALNINTADKEQLQGLTGIGPVTATAIIEYRENSGDFKSVDDLVQVQGIGSVTMEKLRNSVTVGD